MEQTYVENATRIDTPPNVNVTTVADIFQILTGSLEGMTIPQLIEMNIALEKLSEKARRMKIQKAHDKGYRL